MSKKYAVVTTTQTFLHRYVVAEDRLQELNPDSPVELGWADDCVTCEQIDPLSQRFVSENILETKWANEEEVLNYFSQFPELEYLADLSEDQKLTYLNYGLRLDKNK